MQHFAEGAYWRELIEDESTVIEPANARFKKPRVPIIEGRDAEIVPVKYNFSKYLFDIPVSSGLASEVCS